MATFATNQNRHVYVATAYNNTSGGSRKEIEDSSFTPGTIDVKAIGTGNDKEFLFLYKNKKKEIIKSDRIPVKNLDYVKAFKASDLITPLKSVKVTLDSSINGGDPVAGQDYVLRIEFRQWIGLSDKDVYFKDAAVHVTSAMAADKKKFYKAMVAELNAAFSREVGATKDSNPYLTFGAGTAGSEDGIYITEKEQSWALGTNALERVYFDVQPTTIYTGGEDVIWAAQDATTGKYYQDLTPTKANAVVGTNAIGNGAQIADLEYFSLGERGDQYRNVGWPNVVTTEGLADASKQYNVLELHFAFTDQGVNSYRSEKDITIACPLGGSGSEYTVINGIIGLVNTAAGTSVSTLS